MGDFWSIFAAVTGGLLVLLLLVFGGVSLVVYLATAVGPWAAFVVAGVLVSVACGLIVAWTES